MNKALMLSVQPRYAELIFQGEKTIELRRRRPRVTAGDYLLIYVSTPAKCIIGVASVESVIEARIGTLWRRVRVECAITYAEFQAYFKGIAYGYGIQLGRPAKLTTPLSLDTLRRVQPSFNPQGYKYLSRSDLANALVLLRLHRTAVG